MVRLPALIALLVIAGTQADAAPGDLDPAFGRGGESGFDLPAPHRNTFLGRLSVAPDGSLSALFGPITAHFEEDGLLLGTSELPYPWASVHAIQPDNKVLVARQERTWFVSARLERRNADGSLDGRFGQSGIAAMPYNEEIVSLAPLPGGATAVLLRHLGSTLVRRFDERGVLDPRFGIAGRSTVAMAGDGVYFHGLVATNDRAVFVIGTANGKFVVLRLLDGVHDEDFGSGGRVVSPVLGAHWVRRVLPRPDGGAVLVAATSIPGPLLPTQLPCYLRRESGLLFAFDGQGVPDSNLGAGGGAAFQLDGRGTVFSGGAIDLAGRIVVGGVLDPADCRSPGSPFVARLSPAGEIDPSFGSGGIRMLPGSGLHDLVGVSDEGLVVLTSGNSGDLPYTLLKLLGGDAEPSQGDGGE